MKNYFLQSKTKINEKNIIVLHFENFFNIYLNINSWILLSASIHSLDLSHYTWPLENSTVHSREKDSDKSR